jgi:hypothetical protein
MTRKTGIIFGDVNNLVYQLYYFTMQTPTEEHTENYSLPKGESVTVEEPKEGLFRSTIRNILTTFDYETVGSLNKIMLKVNELPQEEKCLHKNDIDILRARIKGIVMSCPPESRIANKQIRCIENVLKNILLEGEQKPKPIPLSYQNLNSERPYTTTTTTKTTYLYMNGSITKIVKKIDDEFASSVMINFVETIGNPYTLSSTITMAVLDLLDVMNNLVTEHPSTFTGLSEDIRKVLENHGWNNGFYSQPNGKSLALDFWKLIDQYF